MLYADDSMLYADDLILLAETSEDLQLQMSQLGIYAKNLRMEINEKKTKVLVFKKDEGINSYHKSGKLEIK